MGRFLKVNVKQINKGDIISVVVLFILFIIFLAIVWGHWGDPIVDSARELYIPKLILGGKVLYKDIFNMYGPLSYQVNAVLYALFGTSINVLYFAGVINTLLILASIYLISRTIASPFTSFIATLTPMCILVFRFKYLSVSGYFLPYSFGLVYAFSALLLSLLFFIYYFKNKNILYLYISSFVIGISIASKLDYAFFALIIVGLLIFSKKIKFSDKFINILLMLLPSVICWSLLFFQGVRFSDIQELIFFGINFLQAPSVKFFNTVIIGLYPTVGNIKFCITNFLSYSLYYLSFLAIASFIVLGFKTAKNSLAKLLFSAILLLFLFPVLKYLSFNIYEEYRYYYDFAWFSYLILFILFLHIATEFFVNKKTYKTISHESKTFILITIIALLSMHRTFFLVFTGFVANYSLILYFTVIIIYLMEILPSVLLKWFSGANINSFKKGIAVFFLIMSVCYLTISYNEFKKHPYKLQGLNGSWYVPSDIGYIIDSTTQYIKKNIKPSQTILMLPEGPILSLITNVATNNKYYSLIPNMTEAFGEDNVLVDLNKNKPDYIFINNVPNMQYGPNEFGDKYMVKTYSFIMDNYDYIKTYPEKGYEYKDELTGRFKFNIKVYKLKNPL